jgi:hypothetical protein
MCRFPFLLKKLQYWCYAIGGLCYVYGKYQICFTKGQFLPMAIAFEKEILRELQQIPGIGAACAKDLYMIGFIR